MTSPSGAAVPTAPSCSTGNGVVDLLPDRSQLTFALWLHQRPEIRLISRDRGGDYAAGATLGAPQAEQLADRFHLRQTAGEVLERCLTRQHAVLAQAARASAPADAAPRTTKRTPAEARRKRAGSTSDAGRVRRPTSGWGGSISKASPLSRSPSRWDWRVGQC